MRCLNWSCRFWFFLKPLGVSSLSEFEAIDVFHFECLCRLALPYLVGVLADYFGDNVRSFPWALELLASLERLGVTLHDPVAYLVLEASYLSIVVQFHRLDLQVRVLVDVVVEHPEILFYFLGGILVVHLYFQVDLWQAQVDWDLWLPSEHDFEWRSVGGVVRGCVVREDELIEKSVPVLLVVVAIASE